MHVNRLRTYVQGLAAWQPTAANPDPPTLLQCAAFAAIFADGCVAANLQFVFGVKQFAFAEILLDLVQRAAGHRTARVYLEVDIDGQRRPNFKGRKRNALMRWVRHAMYDPNFNYHLQNPGTAYVTVPLPLLLLLLVLVLHRRTAAATTSPTTTPPPPTPAPPLLRLLHH